MKTGLFAIATWITPNWSEFLSLTNTDEITSLSETVKLLKKFHEETETNIVLKGGHMNFFHDMAIDLVAYNKEIYILSSPKIESPVETHGTGCTFSAAIAAGFSLGFEWSEVLLNAKAFVFGSINEAVKIGDSFYGMYPPFYSYMDNITLEKYED
jgi:hydroxymethylpyrimidine/phosphomethylpyrimidine kinase